MDEIVRKRLARARAFRQGKCVRCCKRKAKAGMKSCLHCLLYRRRAYAQKERT